MKKTTIKNQQKLPITVEPPNSGQVGTWLFVHYSEVVLYWGAFIPSAFLYRLIDMA